MPKTCCLFAVSCLLTACSNVPTASSQVAPAPGECSRVAAAALAYVAAARQADAAELWARSGGSLHAGADEAAHAAQVANRGRATWRSEREVELVDVRATSATAVVTLDGEPGAVSMLMSRGPTSPWLVDAVLPGRVPVTGGSAPAGCQT